MFNTDKLINMILHRKNGTGLPEAHEIMQDSNNPDIADFKVRRVIWNILTNLEQIKKACVKNYMKRR